MRSSPRTRSHIALSLSVAALAALAGPALGQDAGGAAPSPPAAAPPLTPIGGAPPAGQGLLLGPNVGLAYAGESFWVRPRGLLAVDVRRYDPRNIRDSGIWLDRALIGLEGGAGPFYGRVLADLRGTDVEYALEEAWLAVEPLPHTLRIAGGLLEFPLSYEHMQPEPTLPFVDYSMAAFLLGYHDLGARVDGELWEGTIGWAVQGGGGEGFDQRGERRAGPSLLLQLQSYPFRLLEDVLPAGPYAFRGLSGLWLGGSYAWGWDYRGGLELDTSLRNTLFYATPLEADRTESWVFAYGWDAGPIRILHEFGQFDLFEITKGPTGPLHESDGDNLMMSATIAWRITGEPYDTRLFHQLARPQGFPRWPLYQDGTWGPGMWEIAVRYTNAEGDRAFVPGQTRGLTTTPPSSQEFRTFDVAVNWWPFRTVRLTFQLTRTIADSEPAAFSGSGRDTSFLFRLQLDF